MKRLTHQMRAAGVLGLCLWVLTAAVPAQEIAFDTVAQGAITYHRYGDMDFVGGDMIITNAKTWAWFWRQHTSGLFPPPPLPEVDFEADMIIAVFLGWQSSGGRPRTEVRRADYDADCLCLRVQVEDDRTPGALRVITNPFHIIRIGRLPTDSIFFEHQRPAPAE